MPVKLVKPKHSQCHVSFSDVILYYVAMQDVPVGENWVKAARTSPHYFLKLCVNLQLSPKKSLKNKYHSVMSNSLQPCGLQHTKLPCPSLSPRVCYVHESVMPSNHLILCHPLLLLLLIFPSIRVFSSESVLHMRWPSIGASASASVFSMNIQD